jgi:hypothetical protein
MIAHLDIAGTSQQVGRGLLEMGINRDSIRVAFVGYLFPVEALRASR